MLVLYYSCEEPETNLPNSAQYPSNSSPTGFADSNGKKPDSSTASSTSPSCSQEPSRAVADSSQKPQSTADSAGSTTVSDRPVTPTSGNRASRERDRDSERDRQHRKEKHRDRDREHHKEKKSSRERDRDRDSDRDKHRDKKSSNENSPAKSVSESHHSPAATTAPSSTSSSLPPRNSAIFNPGLHSLSPNPPNPLTPHLFHSPPTPLSPSFPSHLPSSVASQGSFLAGSPFNSSRWGMLSSFMGLPPGPMGMSMGLGGGMGGGPMSLLGPGFDRSGSFFGFPSLPTSMSHGPGGGPGPGAFVGAGHSFLNTSMASSLPSFSPNMSGMNVPGLSGAIPGFALSGMPPSLGNQPSAAAAAAAAASLAGMPGMSMQPGGPQVKKTGRWCAMHVRLAWEIYKHQQGQQASNQNTAEALRLGDLSSLTGPNREFSLSGGRGPLPPSSASLPMPGLSSNFLTRPTGMSGPSPSDLAVSLMQNSPRMPSSWAMRPPYNFALPPNFGLPFQNNPLLGGRDLLSSSLSPGSSSLPGPDSWRRPMAFGGLANPNQLNNGTPSNQNSIKDEKPPEKKPEEKETPKEKRPLEDSENRDRDREKRKRTDSSTRSSPVPPVKKEREKESPEDTTSSLAETPRKPDSKAIDLRNRSESVPGGNLSIPERTKSVNSGLPSFPGNDFMNSSPNMANMASLFPSMPGVPFPPNFWPGQPAPGQSPSEMFWRTRGPLPPGSVPGSDLYARLNSQHPYISERDRLDFLRMRTGNYPGLFGAPGGMPPNFAPNFMRPFGESPFYGQNSASAPSLAAAAALSGADRRISSPLGKRESLTQNGSDKDSPTDLSKSRSSGKESSSQNSAKSSSSKSSSSSSHKEKERDKDRERMSTSSSEKEKS